ncbi:hypothetical protein [Streptomyces sp. NPDC005549]|uniref:hypothetical protein n=1 Tax=Streptomyces sp. NPDC005549 TaxID=3154888 RepID=UPI0033B3CACC
MPNVMSADQPRPTPLCPSRRLVAAGLIRRTPGRTFTVRVTAVGVTGTIAKNGGAR